LVHELDRDQSNDTKELLAIATRHASGEEAVGAIFILADVKTVPGGSRATPSKATDKSIKKGVKGSKKEEKWCPRQVVVTTSGNDDDKEADDFDEGYVAATKHDFKRQVWQSKDHFEKLHKAACSNHTYPIKYKLKNCTMMKNFMTSGALSKGKKPDEDPGGKCVASFPEEAVVITIYN
jgi:hypothetical protein